MTAEKTERATRSDGERSRKAILSAAARLATIEGLEGMSIARLAQHIGMSKSGLYAHFGSKEELQLATVEAAAEVFDIDVVEPTRGIEDPVAKIEALGDTFLSHLARHVFPGGCFFVSVAAEFDTHPGRVKERIAAFQRGWLGMLEDFVREAQKAGAIRADEDPNQLVFEIDSYLLMANMVFLMQGDIQALERARSAYRARLDLART